MKIAPWTDFAGNEIAEGDFLIHPDGKKGCVMFEQSGAYEGVNRWRMVYEDGESLWLGNQIGDKGQAARPEAKNMQAAKFDDRRNRWTFIPRGGSVNLKEFKPTAESIRGMVDEELGQLIDSGGREALIRAGWTPPPEGNAK